MRRTIALALALVGCGYHLERDEPPPPPPESAAPAVTTAPTTTTPAPATTTTPAPATSTVPAGPPATHAPAPSTTTAETATPAICESAYHCCQAAVAAMPIGGLVSGCGELRHADASREAECRQLLDTYRATLTQVGAAIPAACRAH